MCGVTIFVFISPNIHIHFILKISELFLKVSPSLFSDCRVKSFKKGYTKSDTERLTSIRGGVYVIQSKLLMNFFKTVFVSPFCPS